MVSKVEAAHDAPDRSVDASDVTPGRDPEVTSLREQLAKLRAAYQQLSSAHEDARAEAAEQRRRAEQLTAMLAQFYRRLASTRRSVSFRIGRATRLALRQVWKNPLALPLRWLAAFRGKDEILAACEQEQLFLLPAAPRETTRPALEMVERDVRLVGVAPAVGVEPKVAGISGSDLGAELAAATSYSALAPGTWRYVLEREAPAFVLVTACGLVPGTAWGRYGTPGGRDGRAALRELVAWCRARFVPVVYWDTIGTPRPRLGLPRGVETDVVFSVSRRLCAGAGSDGDPAPVLLLPGVEPSTWNPIGVSPTLPRHPIFVGEFDRRLAPAELAARAALLQAAAKRGLAILDRNYRLAGDLAAAVRFPAELEPLCRRRPPLEGERVALKEAGILLCGNTVAGADFPSWQLLRGLAAGTHVVSTPAELGDPTLAGAVALAGTEEAASGALDRLVTQPLLGIAWRAAFERVVASYSLRRRLDEIGRRCGAAQVAARPPVLAVVGRVRTPAERDALVRFLALQAEKPAEVRVLADDGIDVSERIAAVVDPRRVTVLRAAEPGQASGLAEGSASHLVLWRADAVGGGTVVGELGRAALLSNADVIAWSRSADDGAAVESGVYRYGEPHERALLLIRREVAHDGLSAGQDPQRLAAELVRAGARCLVLTGERA